QIAAPQVAGAPFRGPAVAWHPACCLAGPMREHEVLSNYLGGAWIPASSGRAQPVHDPATGERLAEVPLSGAADVDRAVTVAGQALATWRRVPAVQRARTLQRFRDLLERSAQELA